MKDGVAASLIESFMDSSSMSTNAPASEEPSSGTNYCLPMDFFALCLTPWKFCDLPIGRLGGFDGENQILTTYIRPPSHKIRI